MTVKSPTDGVPQIRRQNLPRFLTGSQTQVPSHMRAVARMELPSTRALMICARFSLFNLFMFKSILEPLKHVKRIILVFERIPSEILQPHKSLIF